MHRGVKAGIIAVFVGALAVSAAKTSSCTDEDVQECESMCSASGLVVLGVSCSDNLYDCRCGSSGMMAEDGDFTSDPIFEELEAEGAAIQAEIAAVFDIALDFDPYMMDDGQNSDQLLRGDSMDFDVDGTMDVEGTIEDAFMMEAEEMLDEAINSPDQGGFAILAFVPVNEQDDFGVQDDNLPLALPSFHLACMASFLSDFLLKALQPEGDSLFRDDDGLDGRSMPISDRWSAYGDDYYYDMVYAEESGYYMGSGEGNYVFWIPEEYEDSSNFTMSDFFDLELSIGDETIIYFSENGDEGIYENSDHSRNEYEIIIESNYAQHQKREKREEKTSTWLVATAAVSVAAAVMFSVLCLLALVGFFGKSKETRNSALLASKNRDFGEKAPLLKTSSIQVVPTSTKSGPEMVTSSLMVV